MLVLQTVSIAPNSVNPLRYSQTLPRIPGTEHSNQSQSASKSPDSTVDTTHEPRNSAIPPGTPPKRSALHATNFSTTQDCNDSSTCFRQDNTQPPSSPHTVHYEHATAACNPEPSRELLQKFPSQRAIALTPRRPCPVAIRPQSGEALGNLGVNCAGTNHCISTARKNDTTCRWQLIASTPRGTRLDIKPKR